jgi:hypothetical protein
VTTPSQTIGWVDEPEDEGIVGPHVRIAGWALAPSRIRAVELRLDGHAFAARIGLPRHDVAAVRPGYPDNPLGGFEIVADTSGCAAPPGVVRRRLDIVVVAGDGGELTLATRTLVEPRVHSMWSFVARPEARPFFLVPALSGIAQGGAQHLDTRYSAYASPTTRIGMRVPILYMRTTSGADGDYGFDPGFDVDRRVDGRAIVDDALTPVLAWSRARRLPVLVTLNGGIWADAAGSAPAWDAIDQLEEDPRNCQWNERDEVMPDDHLAHLPGSHASPELARALTLNVYARDVRRYKKRNLQQAAEALLPFIRDTPELLVGVNLDPDVYINPFFAEAQWYDYNPGTLRQFRHWLAGTGPYRGDCESDVPDLTRHARAHALTLAEVEAIAGRRFATFADVDPPRRFSRDAARPFWKDPWVQEWESFRRHLVHLHYDELARWLCEAGLPADRIWSSQGLMAPADDCMPLALAIDSPVKNYDSGGVCLAGSKPRDGHLGAIVYGDSAKNAIAMERGGTLFDTLAAIDPGFAIVEFNTADLRHPERLPSYADGYHALRDLWNANARFVSPMAWNGANGKDAVAPGYVSYTAWRNTPLEDAARDFLLARSSLPPGTKLWTFGSQVHADTDGWQAEQGTLVASPGALVLRGGALCRVALVSPPLAPAPETIGAFVLGLAPDSEVEMADIEARASGETAWRPVVRATRGQAQLTAAGWCIRVPAAAGAQPVDRLRITLTAAGALTLTRVAILSARPT